MKAVMKPLELNDIYRTHRKLGVGEQAAPGDLGVLRDTPTVQAYLAYADHIVGIDDLYDYYRPYGLSAPAVATMPDNPGFAAENWGWPEQRGSKVEVEPERSKALTHDDGKPPLAQVPWAAVKEMANVQLYGQKKYGDFYNYRKGMEVSRNLSCAIRHIAAYMDGENLDPESQCSHLGHAMCRLAFVLQNMQDGTLIDDRYKGGAK